MWYLVPKTEYYRRRGIGTALMGEFEKQTRKRKCRRVFSSVEPWNRVSLAFHMKLGYERCGYIDNIWAEGKRDLFFSKKLQQNRL
jgi:ribosomal protein S18 acetylase RimI-like enzyme